MRFSSSLLNRLPIIQKPPPPRFVSGSQIIYQKLLQKKVTDVFMLSGGSIMPLVDCFYQGPINYIINAHEQNCGHAATGYAKSSGKTGVVITTSGPGITNLVTPMLDAQNDSTPLVVISGQVGLKAMGTDAFQEAPATEITKCFTKFSYCIQKTEEIPEIMDYAFYLANQGKKGVVHLDLPKCVATQELDLNTLGTFDSGEKNHLFDNEFIEEHYFESSSNTISMTRDYYDTLEEQVSEVARVVNEAEKPIFYIGQGCSEASKELKKIVYKNNIPVTSTIHGKGIFPDDDVHSLKWCGMHGMPAANYALQESDCIIGIGSRFDDRTTGNVDYYAPIAKEKKQIIHVDIEPKQFGKSVDSHINIRADSQMFLDMLYPLVEENRRLLWSCRIGQLKTIHDFKYNTLERKMNTPMVIECINEVLNYSGEKYDYHISTGVGNHQMMTYQFIDGFLPKKIHSSGSLGVMGAGLPYAVGIQVANPDSLVIDIDGDSSFMMTLGDLKTIKENNLPIKIAIMNDSKQMMVNVWEKLFFEGRHTATENKRNPNFDDLAESFGIKSFKCRQAESLMEVTKKFLNYPGPALCEYVVEPEICLPLVGPGKALDDMVLFEEYHHNSNNLKLDKTQVPS